ncbi:MAG: hypothetical protein EBU59_07505 [Planctomycetia bacterium]|nr:hypothetical protein [Planctomycetia bacterium]
MTSRALVPLRSTVRLRLHNHSLTFAFTGGQTAIGGGFANIQTLTALTSVSLNGAVQTNLDQNYAGPVSLGGATSLSGNAASFSSGIIGNTKDLFLNFTSLTSLDNVVNVRDLQSIGNVAIAGGLLTVGSQTYNGTVELAASTLLSGTKGTFAKGLAGGGNDLTLRFPGAPVVISGGFTGIGNLSAETAVSLNGSVETSGFQSYLATAVLAGSTNLNASEVIFAGAVTGGQSLSINATGPTTFGSTVGNQAAPLTSIVVSGGGQTNLGGNVSTVGNQTYGGDLNLTKSTVLSGLDESIAGTITGNGNSLTLNFSGVTELTGAKLTGVNNLSIIGGGTAQINGTILTTGNQNFADTIELLGDVGLQSGNGTITTAAVSGPNNTLSIGLGNQTGSVTLGGNLALGGLLTNSGSYDLAITGSVNNVAGSTILATTGNVTLGDGATDTSRLAGGLTARDAQVTFTAGTITTAGGVVVLNGTSLTANTAIDTTDAGAVPTGAEIDLTNGTALNGFTLDTYAGNAATVLTGPTNLSSGVLEAKTGSLNLGTPSAPAAITASQNTAIVVASGGTLNLFSGSSVDAGNFSLTIQTDAFQAASGAGNISAADITVRTTTSGRDIFLGDTTGSGLVIDQRTFNALQAAEITVGEAGFNGTIDVGNLTVSQGRLDLVANGSGAEVLIDGSLVLNAASVPDGISLLIEGSGATTVLNGTITAANDVVINDALQVTGGDQLIDTSGSNGNVTIAGGNATVSGGLFAAAGQTNSLTITAGTGTVTLGTVAGLGDNKGAGALISNVTISAGSTVLGNTASEVSGTFAVTSGTLTLANNLTAETIDVAPAGATLLAGNVTLAGATLNLAGGLEGNAYSLVLNFTNTTALDGSFANLTDLTSEGDVTLDGTITTIGSQTYNGSATLAGDTALSGASLSLASGMAGNTKSLALNFSSTTALGGAFSNLTNLSSEGDVTFNGTVTTIGSQTYNGTAALTGDTTLAGKSLSLASGLAGNANSLALNFTSPTALDGSFSNLTNLSSEGDVTLNGTVATLGSQVYNATATLAGNTTLEGATLLLASGIEGAGKSLVLNFSTATDLDGTFANLADLSSEGPVVINGSIATTGSQTYNSTTTLAGDAALSGTTLSLAAGMNGAGNSLDLNFTSQTSLSGSFASLANLSSEGPVEVNGSIATTGTQTYNSTVTLAGDTDLTGQSGIFTGGIAGNSKALTLNFAQTTTIDGAAGVFSNIGDFTVVGDANLNATIQTTGFQSYGGVTTLLGDTKLNTGGGNVSFGGVVDGAERLEIEAGSGRVDFFADLGKVTPLRSLNLTSASAVTALGTVAIDGSGAGSDGLLIGAGVNNVNMTQPGSTIANANLAGIRFAGGSDSSRVGGFAISGSGGAGVELSPGSYKAVFIEDNVLTAGGADGVYANGTRGGVTIEGNRIGGNAGSGVWMQNASNFKGWVAVVANNTIGLDAAGNAAQPNAGQGIIFLGGSQGSAINNTIGGSGYFGIVVQDGAFGISLTENRIGVAADFSTPVPNGQSGIFVLGGATGTVIAKNTIRGNSGMAGIQVVDGSTNTMIGGVTAGDANLIVGNGEFGITVSGD